MKKVGRSLFLFCSMVMMVAFYALKGNADGPLDGQVIDGSLLTSEQEAFDEKPLIPENPFESEIVPYGTYLSYGTVGISQSASGVVYISGDTICYRTCDSVQVNLYLERLSNGSWSNVTMHHYMGYNTYAASTGIAISVPKGYYYRVRGGHVAKKGSVTESTTTCTNGIYIN